MVSEKYLFLSFFLNFPYFFQKNLRLRNERSLCTNRDEKNRAVETSRSSVVTENPKYPCARFISSRPIAGVTKEIPRGGDPPNANFALRIPFRSSKRISVASRLRGRLSNPRWIPPRSGIKSGAGKFAETTRGAWNLKTSKTVVSILPRGRNLAGLSARIIPTWDKTEVTSVCRKLGA